MASDQGFGTIREHFGELEDPRIDRTKLHELLERKRAGWDEEYLLKVLSH